jgi:hypothetical protein
MNTELRKIIENIIYNIINEDFNFGKLKKDRLEDEYKLKPLIREQLKNLKVDKVFIDLYGDKGPFGLSNQHYIKGFGNVVCRGHSLDNIINYRLEAKKLLNAKNYIRSADLIDLQVKFKFKPVEYASRFWLEHHTKSSEGVEIMPDYLTDLL